MDEIKLLNILKNDPRISSTDLADILNESEENVIKTKLKERESTRKL